MSPKRTGRQRRSYWTVRTGTETAFATHDAPLSSPVSSLVNESAYLMGPFPHDGGVMPRRGRQPSAAGPPSSASGRREPPDGAEETAIVLPPYWRSVALTSPSRGEFPR